MSVERVEKVSLPLVVVFSVFLAFISIVWISLLPSGLWHFYNLGIVACPLQLTSAPFITILLLITMNKAGLLKKLKVSTIVYFYVAAVSVAWYTDYAATSEWYAGVWHNRRYYPDVSLRYVPWYLAPPTEEVERLLVGGPINWGAWTIPILYWSLLHIVFYLFMASIITIFRRRWIDVEKVPFTHVIAAHEIIRYTFEEKGETKAKLIKPFSIGILLGLIVQIPIYMTVMFPWFPDIYGWRVNTCGHGGYWIPTESPLSSIVGLSMIQKHPIFIAIGYLVPLSTLFSTWIFFLVYLIAVQVAFTLGYYTGIDTIGGCGRAWCGTITPNFGEPFKFMSLSYVGGSTALTLIYLLLNWRYVRDTISAALGRGPLKRYEDEEPMPYRYAYALLVVSIILIVIVLSGWGMGVASSLILVFTVFIFWIANTRIWGLAGCTLQGAEHGNAFYRLFMWPQAPQPPTMEFMASAYLSEWLVDVPKSFGGAALSFAAGYKMANLTNIRSRDVFKAVLIAGILGYPVVMATYVYMCHTFGLTHLPVWADSTYDSLIDRCGNPDNWNVRPGEEPWWPNFLAGFIIVTLLSWLHARFIWFPLEPIGFILGTCYMSNLWGIWFPFLISWVLKTLTLRVGGTRAYEDYGIPVAVGFITGYMVAVLVGGAIGIVRFFVPF
ncbi:hypothetical protein DRO58_07550 [Candidatus Bathyarchaeota archaeon]|nr:MAG: hypothetical protein DRO58_07550 [Candidatus Bathyarchaeota archaeon]